MHAEYGEWIQCICCPCASPCMCMYAACLCLAPACVGHSIPGYGIVIIGILQDGGSLDLVMKAGRIPVDMIAKITFAVSICNI